MYNSQLVSERIKLVAKKNSVTISQLLADCELGKNTIVKLSNGTDIMTQNIFKIADYLGCSVDYLLGRDTAGSLTDKQKWLLDSYEKLSDEYRRLIERKLEQYAAEDEEYRVFEEIKERKKKRMIESLSEEKNISAPSAKK